MQAQLTRPAVTRVAVGTVLFAVALNAFGVYADGSDSQGTREFLVVSAIILAAALFVFGWLVPRVLRRESFAVAALTLSVLGLLAVAAFWSGVPPMLAGAGALLGWAGWDEARGRGM